MAEDDIEAEVEESTSTATPFQLQFDKPIPSQVRIAEWNPEKDLLAMVTEDSKVILHRFNWQRLWTISPGKCVTSICWRPDGKAIALGLEDGLISLHDVENGKLLRKIKLHSMAVTCLNWEEDAELIKLCIQDDSAFLAYEDRTMRFFPPSPRIPRMPGLVSGDNGLMDDSEDSLQDLCTSSHQRFNILCSGDKDGCICFSIFGIFPIGKINIHKLPFYTPFLDNQTTYKMSNASIHKVAFSKNLCQLIVLSFGELYEEVKGKDKSLVAHAVVQREKSSFNDGSLVGLHCFLLNTSIFSSRKNELHQVAQQASNVEDLLEVIRSSLSVMSKHWSGAMNSFHDKFDSLSSLIANHGLDSSPHDEFLSLLCGARTSPPLHQFLVNSVGEMGLKRVAKTIDTAGKELHLIIREHLQPAIEIIGFRIGELRGLSRWRARYQIIGLDEKLINKATENTGMFIVQVERFLRVLAIVIYQFQNFFNWLSKCIKMLLSEPTDQIQPSNSELVVIFLKFLLNNDPVGQLLELYDVNCNIEVDFLKEAFLMPFSAVSMKINCEDFLSLYPAPSPSFSSPDASTSVSYYEDNLYSASGSHASPNNLVDYICFKIPDESLDMVSCICILRGFTNNPSSFQKGFSSLEAVLLCIPEGYDCVDLALYKDEQVVLLLNQGRPSVESPERALMMMIQASDLSFAPISRTACANYWSLHQLKVLATDLHLENGKIRRISHSVTKPLAVSASRGVACVYSSRRHALVYILEEDEEETSDIE